jgi:hypothetical protein
VQRLQFLAEVRAQVDMLEFRVGDRVSFQPNQRETIEGMVIRRNKKTVTMVTDDHHQWNVAPGLLLKVEGKALEIPVSLSLVKGPKAFGKKRK